MTDSGRRRWTIEQFLVWEDGSDRRYELVGGRIVPMPRPTEAHGALVANLMVEVGGWLEPPCRGVAPAGIVPPGRDDTFYQADLAVTCAPPQRGGRHVVEPVLIAEVLLPESAEHDRGVKLDDYRQIPSVREVLLVSSEERRVEHWRRDGGRWAVEERVGDGELRLEVGGEVVPLAAIYEGSDV